MSSPSRSPGLPARVLFLNDVAFQYGAGIGQARQVEALLSLGIEVGVIAWAPGEIGLEKVATRAIDPTLWRGVGEVAHLEGGKEFSDDALIAGLLMEIARFRPEVVLIGNLHAARWPLSLLSAIARIGCRVIAFVHDAYLFTGRCAYPGDCRLYLTGCNATCPTANEYPALAPELIAGAWQTRRDVFGGPHGFEVVTNSHWSREMFRAAIPTATRVETIELGAEATVFRPGDKLAARRHFGIREDRPVVMCAAVNFQEARKGGRQLRAIIEALKDECTFIAFGHNAHEIPDLVGLGYHLEAHVLALAYQAADLFLGTATEEAFGQTIMEAQLCGLPVVAFLAGGVPEIVRNEFTGRLVKSGNIEAAIAAIRESLADPDFMSTASAQARALAEARFSVEAHAARWAAYFAGHRQTSTGTRAPIVSYCPPPHPAPEEPEPFRPSWPDSLATPPERLAELARIPGWSSEPETAKLVELAYHSGDVIIEVGPHGARTAVATLAGAQSNASRTLPARYFGLCASTTQLSEGRRALLAVGATMQAHLIRCALREFLADWSITPTMVILDGQHDATSLQTMFNALSSVTRPGTPIFLRDYLDPHAKLRRPAARAVGESIDANGYAVLVGCFGRAALFTTRNVTA